MSAPSAVPRSLVDGIATPCERFGDLPAGARIVLCLYGGLYVLALMWVVPKCSLAAVVPLLAVLTAAGLERGWSDPAGQKVFIAGSGVRMVVTLICPPEALLVGGLGSGLGSGLSRGWSWPTASNVSMWALGTALASAVRLWVLGHAGPIAWVALAISIVTALAVYSLANILMCSVFRGARYRRPFPGEWRRHVRTHWPANLTHLPLVAALAALALSVENPWLRMALPAVYLLVMWAPPDPRTERSFGTYWTRPVGVHRLWMSTGANVLDAADTCERLRSRTDGRGGPWSATARTLEALAGDGLAPDAVQALLRAVRHDAHEVSRV